MAFGVTPQGFVRKSYADILQALEDRAKLEENFGPEIDLSPYGELGIILQNVAREFDEVWQGLEETYYSKFINQASGVQLDRIVSQGGLSRIPARKSTVQVKVSGTQGAEVSSGFIIQTANGIQFEITNPGVLTADPAGTEFSFRSIESGGKTIVAAGTITEIVTQLPDVNSVTNPGPSSGGGPMETDAELRQRYKDRGASGGSSLPAIRETILGVNGVSSVFIYENVKSTIDEGRPPHSIEIVVSGTPPLVEGNPTEAYEQSIANAIFNSKPAGIETFAQSGVNQRFKSVTDANGQDHMMYWAVPGNKIVYVAVKITKNSEWSPGNEAVIKTRVVQLIGGIDTVGTESVEYPGLDLGVDVTAWQVIANFDGIKGIDNVVVYLSFTVFGTIPPDPTWVAKLAIGASEFAQTDTSKVKVYYTP